MKKIPINTDTDGLARTITSDYGHSSKYHVLLSGRYSMMGVIEYEERTDGRKEDETPYGLREDNRQGVIP